jgi:hypothetical protein
VGLQIGFEGLNLEFVAGDALSTFSCSAILQLTKCFWFELVLVCSGGKKLVLVGVPILQSPFVHSFSQQLSGRFS